MSTVGSTDGWKRNTFDGTRVDDLLSVGFTYPEIPPDGREITLKREQNGLVMYVEHSGYNYQSIRVSWYYVTGKIAPTFVDMTHLLWKAIMEGHSNSHLLVNSDPNRVGGYTSKESRKAYSRTTSDRHNKVGRLAASYGGTW